MHSQRYRSNGDTLILAHDGRVPSLDAFRLDQQRRRQSVASGGL